MSNTDDVTVRVPLWTVLTAMGTTGAAAFVWLFSSIQTLSAELLELHKLIHELTNFVGM